MINNKKFKSVGIVGFGGYLPYWRVETREVAEQWQMGEAKAESLGVKHKAVVGRDEDCLTMAVEASITALRRAKIKPKKIGAVFVGSESHPYAVKPTGTILADVLGIGSEYFVSDLQFACKAGTAGLQIIASMITRELAENVINDTMQDPPLTVKLISLL